MTVPDFDHMYTDGSIVPWHIDGPQPLLVSLVEAGEVRGEVLDAGCGPGTNAVYLASQGFSVTGVDGSAPALKLASDLAAERGVRVELLQRDATSLGFSEAFDTVVDSALYHCLDADAQRAYAASLHQACRPGATLHMFARSEENPDMPGPPCVSEENLRTTFAHGWEITRLRPAWYTLAFKRENLGDIPLPEATPVDDQGRFLMPVWQLTAIRR